MSGIDARVVASAFVTIFVAELGDKTQLAAMTMAGSTRKPWSVLLGAAAALVLVTVIGVALGETIARIVPEVWMKRIAGLLFIGFGVYTLLAAD